MAVRRGLTGRRVYLATALIAAALLNVSGATAGGTTVAADYYGINSGSAFSGPPAGWPAAAAQIAQLGVGTVRRDAFWSAIEPTPPRDGEHHYRWHHTDQLVEALAESGLRWYPILDYGVAWASVGGWESPPTAAHVRDYGKFAAALAGRYGNNGSFWRAHSGLPPVPVANYEIWNEPNVHHFWPEQSYAASRLARMYSSAQTQIDAIDPTAQVVLGGLSAIGLKGFLTRMMRAQPALHDRLEAVGFHPYGGGDHAGVATTYARIRALRAILHHLVPERQVPIEITETGWAVPPFPNPGGANAYSGSSPSCPALTAT